MIHRAAIISAACSFLVQLGWCDVGGAKLRAPFGGQWMVNLPQSIGAPNGAGQTDSRAVVYGSNGQARPRNMVTW